MIKQFLETVKSRRTYYQISKEVAVSDEKIEEIITEAVKHSPTAFNSQGGRVVLLLAAQHDKLWDITKETLRKIIPADKFTLTEEKIDSFKKGYGTVLYFEDQSVVESLQKKFPFYKDNFPIWSQQSSGMLQYIIWTALEEEGLGASLQHYNPLIDDAVKEEWEISDTWKLIGQMPFGQPIGQPKEKEFQALEGRMKILK